MKTCTRFSRFSFPKFERFGNILPVRKLKLGRKVQTNNSNLAPILAH